MEIAVELSFLYQRELLGLTRVDYVISSVISSNQLLKEEYEQAERGSDAFPPLALEPFLIFHDLMDGGIHYI